MTAETLRYYWKCMMAAVASGLYYASADHHLYNIAQPASFVRFTDHLTTKERRFSIDGAPLEKIGAISW